MQKVPYIRSEKHRRFIASLPCIICGRDDVQAAHIRHQNGGGLGLKPGDDQTIPLCCSCHSRQHQIGEVKFWGSKLEPVKLLATALWQITGDRDQGIKMVNQFIC